MDIAMLAPHELKSKAFSKTLKGYSPAEVDDYIEFLIDKYTELYRENNELERKLKIVVTNFDEIRDEEEAIRSTLLKAQKLGEKIIRDANERADVITGSIKDRCDAIISSFREQLKAEKNEMWEIRTRIIDFKKNLYDIYRQHIEELQGLSVNEIEDIVLPDENEIVGRIFTDVRETIKNEIASESARRSEELPEEQPAVSAGTPAPQPRAGCRAARARSGAGGRPGRGFYRADRENPRKAGRSGSVGRAVGRIKSIARAARRRFGSGPPRPNRAVSFHGTFHDFTTDKDETECEIIRIRSTCPRPTSPCAPI